MIPYGRQDINQEDIDSVVEVLRSDFLTQGAKVPLFEQTLTNYTSALHAVVVNSATSALHIACLALGLGKGDLLWTSPVTFVASANCGLYCGAEVDFVDIDQTTHNLCPTQLEKKLVVAKKENKLPKIVVPVHFAGQSCDMEKIHALSKKYGFNIIEDGSHAIGGRYRGEPVGNCKYSDITVFSFHPVKIVTTGEGGSALTNNKELADKMFLYRSHGITRDKSQMTDPLHGDWYYQQVELGFNYRMTELQAALGISQMKRLDEFVHTRHVLANRYNSLFVDMPLILPQTTESAYSSHHLYVVKLRLEAIKQTQRQIFNFLRRHGIGVNLHYIPIHTQPYYQKLGFRWGDFPNAEQYYKETITLPLYTSMTYSHQNKIKQKLLKAFVD